MSSRAAKPSDASTGFAFVVAGGSAGSFDPLAFLLKRLPKDFALPMAVVIHSPRNPPLALADAIAPISALPVREAEDKEPACPGTVYLAPAGYHLLVDRGPRFALSVDSPVNFSRPSIDVLFESAADELGERLIAVLLSGANADGAQGMKAVVAAGGLALVQEPSEATSREMPASALSACPTAEALPVSGIADRLARIHRAVRERRGNP